MKLYLKEINKHILDEEEHVVIPITKGYIQQFVEDNYKCKLTKEQIDELSIIVWEGNDHYLMNWIGEAVEDILNGRT